VGYRGRRSTVEEIAKKKLAGPPGPAGTTGAAGGAATSDFNRINIGSQTVGNSACSSISALLIYSATHDDTTRKSIEGYLGNLYGIAVS